ncbi:mannitol dehydrogenase family protein [Williamsia sp. CHRR-6]|uniref:mannitol dehydrogenase family protein n=1 Tax=Williamsia sp. CHRR-6 TaxID=2835871 RepID=UPI001BDB4F1F|nr:mannitol dehydrogenase family protein [Williamsia sp. CHRR-6]MBT0565231.1 mannitol dehydrogenase family protein [Williamsia sp. CHRR-6]
MSSPVRLDEAHLPQIGSIAVPTYRRRQNPCGMVHFGVGGFHRAHQAMYVDRLLAATPLPPWSICGVGVLPGDARMRDALVPQDGLYTLTLKHPDGVVETSVIGSIVDYLFAPDDPEQVIETLAAPTTRIVSLTVTEGGYNISGATGEFDLSAPDVAADLVPNAIPRTTFGLITEALRRRRARGIASFTVMSCDNIPGNGHMARRVFTAFARAQEPALAEWMQLHTSFPNSMVDRITPATPTDLADEVAARTGVIDRWPVVAEPFTQWVLEDDFSAGRPAFEAVGVQMVTDVAPYELMKLRLLNAGHQTLCYVGYLMGYRKVDEATADPLVQRLLRAYMQQEGRPTLAAVPGVDLDVYIDTLIERFANPAIGDTIARLCAESSDRIPQWLVPVVAQRLDAGGSVRFAAAVIAAWTRYAEGVDEQGEPIEIVDQRRDLLVPLARRSRDEPLAFVSVPDLFGDLAQRPGFVEPYTWALARLRTVGVRAMVDELLKDSA